MTALMSSTNPRVMDADYLIRVSLFPLSILARQSLTNNPKCYMKHLKAMKDNTYFPKSESWWLASLIALHCTSEKLPNTPTLMLIIITKLFNMWCWFHSSVPSHCRELNEISPMPTISWTASSIIHHKLSGMQYGFFISRYTLTS